MNLTSKSGVLTIVAGLLLIVPAAIGLLPDPAPTISTPLPVLTVLPYLFLSYVHCGLLAICLPSVLFLVWNPQLFREHPSIPKRSYILFGILVALSALFFYESWQWGIQYQGRMFTVAMALINLSWVSIIGVGFCFWKGSRASFASSLILHWLLFAWLAWYAFPWLGEMI